MEKKSIEDVKQWLGDLLYENGVHQRETQIFDKAENELEAFITSLVQQSKEEVLNELGDLVNSKEDEHEKLVALVTYINTH